MKLTLHSNLVQILLIGSNHWIVISNLHSEAVSVIDVCDTIYMYDQIVEKTRIMITSIFEEDL